MKHTTTTLVLSGTNESPIAGLFVVGSTRDFVTRGVVAGVSMLYNRTTGAYGSVATVTPTTIQAVSVDSPDWFEGEGWFVGGWFGNFLWFSPGDFFEVTLASPWTLQTADGPVIEVECNRCGWSYPNRVLVNGLCKTCIDQPRG